MSAAERAGIVIIGAGQAGLGSAYAAQRAGLEPVVLEAAVEPAGSWPHYYESLELFSPARYSALPGRPLPGDPERYPTRDELAAYLRDYADRLGADIRTEQRVTRVSVLGDRDFEVGTESGLLLRAPYVIAATGGFGRPHRPQLPGEETFEGSVVHTSEYRRPDGYAGQRVIVVGGGNSAVQVADELARVARVSLATRSPIKWQAQRPLGRDMHWWFDRSGLDAAPIGRLWLRLDGNPVVDDGRYRAALAAGLYDRRPMFTRFVPDGVQWADGSTEPVAAVILATGYRPSLDFLAGTAALGEHGEPLHRAGVSTTIPGLGYVGLEFQRSFRSATVRGVGPDARRVIRRLRRRGARAGRSAAGGHRGPRSAQSQQRSGPAQQPSPRQVWTPSRTATAAITNAATGSSHQRPKSALPARPRSTAPAR
jgi:putative flavoprotein involved in K+ transport